MYVDQDISDIRRAIQGVADRLEPAKRPYIAPPAVTPEEAERVRSHRTEVKTPRSPPKPRGSSKVRNAERAEERFLQIARTLDLILDPNEAEEVIGDLLEQYLRRSENPRYANRWLRAQVIRIVLNEMLKWVAKAASSVRAGK